MNGARKLAFLILAALAILAVVRFGPFSDNGEQKSLLDDLSSIDRVDLADIPHVDVSISTFQEKIRDNPQDVVSYTILGQMYVRQARETGNVASYQMAEDSLHRALELVPDSPLAVVSLASVYYAQHDFGEALGLAQSIYKKDPSVVGALATLGDAHLALGHYTQAEEYYRALMERASTPTALARLAHLAELRGDPEEALRLLRQAAEGALGAGLSRQDTAWFLLRLGDLHFMSGRIDEAAEHYQASITIFDDYYVALARLGSARAAQGEYDKAIDLYERSVAIVPEPATLSRLGDLYAVRGDTSLAQEQYDTVQFIAELAEINKTVYSRELALFYADHDLEPDKAVEVAREELVRRQDVHAYDTLAWTLYKSGQIDEAADAMAAAMRLGTQD